MQTLTEAIEFYKTHNLQGDQACTVSSHPGVVGWRRVGEGTVPILKPQNSTVIIESSRMRPQVRQELTIKIGPRVMMK